MGVLRGIHTIKNKIKNKKSDHDDIISNNIDIRLML